jgi:hypothetical protein
MHMTVFMLMLMSAFHTTSLWIMPARDEGFPLSVTRQRYHNLMPLFTSDSESSNTWCAFCEGNHLWIAWDFS